MTPIGRITIIKTIIIPKLNQLILTLPNPSNDFLKILENEIYQFLWLGKVHKVRKNTIVQDYYHGGLKMVGYPSFITSLKATWIKRLIYTETKWINLLESTMELSINTIIAKRQRLSIFNQKANKHILEGSFYSFVTNI